MTADASGALTLDEIKARIPHREPMLMIDRVLERSANHIVCQRTFRADEYFLQGHYPHYPLVPGVLLCEMAMQAGAILVAEQQSDRSGAPSEGEIPVATRLSEVKFRRMVRPGETITARVDLTDRAASAYFMQARLSVDNQVAMRCEFACAMARHEP